MYIGIPQYMQDLHSFKKSQRVNSLIRSWTLIHTHMYPFNELFTMLFSIHSVYTFTYIANIIFVLGGMGAR